MEISDILKLENDKHTRGWAIRAAYSGAVRQRQYWEGTDVPVSPVCRGLVLSELDSNLRRMESIARQVGVSLDD